jgi:MYXO-CTERM domain-containing protein
MRRLGPWLAVALAALGCRDEASGVGSGERAIVDGTRETGEDEVVFIFNERGAACTATVIAPRVALTAKHCVQGMSASGWRMMVGSGYTSFFDEYAVLETRTTPGTDIEDKDIAVMILDRPFEHGLARWEFTRWPGLVGGVRVTAVGFGLSDPDDPRSSGFKNRREGYVSSLGYVEFTTLENNACSGDSGGPVLFEGVQVGVMSRVAEGCVGLALMTRVSGFYDLIAEALRDTGACVPTAFETCNGIDDDCWNGIDDGLEGACGCAGGAPPSAEACNRVDDDCNGVIDDLDGCACRGGAAPSAEACDGIDNDCDDAVDETCLPLGAPCTSGDECRSLDCREIDGTRVCTAACGPFPDAACPEGGYCDVEGCGEGLCRPWTAGGSGGPGSSCTRASECSARFCLDGRCERRCVRGGLDCYADEACEAGEDGCGACRPASEVPGPRASGEPCGSDGDCDGAACVLDDAWGASEGDGERFRYCAGPCSEGGLCGEGRRCVEGRCARGARASSGEPCGVPADCGSGTCAEEGEGGRCLESCSDGGTCVPGFRCNGGYCRPTAARLGDRCGPSDPCDDGECVSFAGGSACVRACRDVSECPSGLACIGEGDRERGWCAPAWALRGGEGCGCAVPGGGGARPVPLVVLLLGAALAIRRRRDPPV